MEEPAAHDPLIGLTIGNYQVTQKLGEGGMGSVYLAEHPLIGKKVALKVLHAEFTSNKDVVARFFTEAKAVNDIQHPNIVDIIDYGQATREDGSSMVYFLMEFLAGDSLAAVMRREAPLAVERAQAIAIQIADALAASHVQGIVHRDLKPENIIMTHHGRQGDFVKVLDFGIAKLTGEKTAGSNRTRTGIVMGTPAYMSPEQCEGRGNVDHRTDVYALGIVLFEMLTGHVPFKGEGYGEVLIQHMTHAPPRPSSITARIPPHLEAVCLKALEKRADERFPNMGEFLKALANPIEYVEGHGGLDGFVKSTLPPTTPYPLPAPGGMPSGQSYYMTPVPMPARKSRLGWFIALGILFGAAIAGMLWALNANKDASEPVVDKPIAGAGIDAGGAVVTVRPDARLATTSGVVDAGPRVGQPPDGGPAASGDTVQITVEQIDPPDASVFVGNDEKCNTTINCVLVLRRGAKAIAVTFKKARYKPERLRIIPQESAAIRDIKLARDEQCLEWGEPKLNLAERKKVQVCKKCNWPTLLGKGSCDKRETKF